MHKNLHQKFFICTMQLSALCDIILMFLTCKHSIQVVTKQYSMGTIADKSMEFDKRDYNRPRPYNSYKYLQYGQYKLQLHAINDE